MRSILSPGVEIREIDLSHRTPDFAGTDVFVTGYATKGPTDELIKPSSLREFESIYGNPCTPAERYFYYTVQPLFAQNANVWVSRLPYGASLGEGFGSLYGALVFPTQVVTPDALNGTMSAVGTNMAAPSATYVLGKPKYFNLTRAQYLSAVNGTGFSWTRSASASGNINGVTDFGGAGVVVLNKSQSTINNRFEGFYLTVSDNTNLNPATEFDSVLSVESVTQSAGSTGLTNYINVPDTRINFVLSGSNTSTGTISEITENLSDFDISDKKYNDVLQMGVFKLRQSIFSPDAIKLDYVIEDRLAGSLDYFRQIGDQSGGPAESFFFENKVNSQSRNITVRVNDNITNRLGDTWLDANGNPTKRVRVYAQQLLDQINDSTIYQSASSVLGISPLALSDLASNLDLADNMYPIGAYSNETFKDKKVGNLPAKLDRVLDLVRNDEIYDIDITCEGGLGTIYAVTSANNSEYYDDTADTIGLRTGLDALATTRNYTVPSDLRHDLRGNYNTIFSKFQTFAELERKDHLFIADPIRQILVRGVNTKTLADNEKTWSQHVFSPMRHQFSLANSSYATAYGNWARVNDKFSQTDIWVPFSGTCAGNMVKTDFDFDPWWAPAGFTRGRVFGVNDMAIEPNQKQRDDLYKFGLNPISSFKEGFVIFGQKTLQKQPGAFDRINVRRLFLILEKITKATSRYYVFEPNTLFTRTRFKDDLRPIFEKAKRNEGVYDYILVCDERNNTPDVIDANEMVMDIYIKPVRAAEFILVNFYATRTGTDFEELIG